LLAVIIETCHHRGKLLVGRVRTLAEKITYALEDAHISRTLSMSGGRQLPLGNESKLSWRAASRPLHAVVRPVHRSTPFTFNKWTLGTPLIVSCTPSMMNSSSADARNLIRLSRTPVVMTASMMKVCPK